MAAKKTDKKKIKTLATRSLSATKAKAVKGGIGDIKGESTEVPHPEPIQARRR
jgi:hypothetical protein